MVAKILVAGALVQRRIESSAASGGDYWIYLLLLLSILSLVSVLAIPKSSNLYPPKVPHAAPRSAFPIVDIMLG